MASLPQPVIVAAVLCCMRLCVAAAAVPFEPAAPLPAVLGDVSYIQAGPVEELVHGGAVVAWSRSFVPQQPVHRGTDDRASDGVCSVRAALAWCCAVCTLRWGLRWVAQAAGRGGMCALQAVAPPGLVGALPVVAVCFAPLAYAALRNVVVHQCWVVFGLVHRGYPAGVGGMTVGRSLLACARRPSLSRPGVRDCCPRISPWCCRCNAPYNKVVCRR